MVFSAASLSCRCGNVKENPPFLQQKRSVSASEQLSNLQNRTFLWDLFVLLLCCIFLCSLLLIPERHAEPPKPNHTADQTEHISNPRSDDCHNETENQNSSYASLLSVCSQYPPSLPKSQAARREVFLDRRGKMRKMKEKPKRRDFYGTGKGMGASARI